MSTVRKIIYADEWHPVYELYDTKHGKFVDFPEELLEDYERIFNEFDAMQQLLSKLYDEGISVQEAATWAN